MQDVALRLRYRVQLTTDGHKPYLAAVEDSFGADIDYATLTKIRPCEGIVTRGPDDTTLATVRLKPDTTVIASPGAIDCHVCSLLGQVNTAPLDTERCATSSAVVALESVGCFAALNPGGASR